MSSMGHPRLDFLCGNVVHAKDVCLSGDILSAQGHNGADVPVEDIYVHFYFWLSVVCMSELGTINFFH